MFRHTRSRLLILAILVVLCLILPAAPAAADPPATYDLRVNCGGPLYRDWAGKIWRADKMYTGASWGYVAGTISRTTAPIMDTPDDPLYQRGHTWLSSMPANGYYFPVPNGDYMVMFKFAEPYWNAAGQRVFTVKLEGVACPALTDYDIFVAALNNKNKAAPDVVCETTVTDGELSINFAKVRGAPLVNAIWVHRVND